MLIEWTYGINAMASTLLVSSTIAINENLRYSNNPSFNGNVIVR